MFSNLYNVAARMIPQQTALWYRFTSRTLDDFGKRLAHYHPPESVLGRWQAVDAQVTGLDTGKVYRWLTTSHDIYAIQRWGAPDYLLFNGKRYGVTGDAEGYAQEGWKSVLFIEAGNYDG
ncbi:phage collar protein [Erwinia amylovora]|uniref:phage collar protein n=1 Tax=Erwinia amylovora TaxID=552 RepID=UPI001443B74C|nr:hypothetical protein [Erwinia amylovora]